MLRCPGCNAVLVAAQDVTPAPHRPRLPRLGDLGICWTCGAAFMLAPGGWLVALTPAQIAGLPSALRAALEDEQQMVRGEVH